MATDMTRIRYQIAKYGAVQNLMPMVNSTLLSYVHEKQETRKATGVDGVDKLTYEEHLEENIDSLLSRMKSFSYRPQPVRRAYIPKLNGKLRPLGIPSYEDRLVQGAMAEILNEVYECIFLPCSYGFRPGLGCHDAIRTIDRQVMSRDVNWVLEADIRGFFDNVSHDWLMKFLAHDIQDKNFLRYIKRFLKAGIMEDGQFIESTQGTPQGGLISPILANVYLHYVLDDWMVHAIIPKLRGKACYVRYADDFVILFQNEDEARETLEKLKQRLAIFSLEVAEEKTRILPFGPKYGTQEDFDFLGFTIYNTTTLGKKTKKKWYRVGIRTCMTKLKAKMQLAKKWIKAHMHMKVKDTLKQLNLKYRGHCQYYGVNGNIEMLAKFRKYLMYILFKTMRRRGQKGKISWDRFIELWEEFIDKPKIKVQIWKGR